MRFLSSSGMLVKILENYERGQKSIEYYSDFVSEIAAGCTLKLFDISNTVQKI